MKRTTWEQITGLLTDAEVKKELTAEQRQDTENRHNLVATFDAMGLHGYDHNQPLPYSQCSSLGLKIPITRTNIPDRIAIGSGFDGRGTPRTLVATLGYTTHPWWSEVPLQNVLPDPKLTIEQHCITNDGEDVAIVEELGLFTDMQLFWFSDLRGLREFAVDKPESTTH